MAEKKRLMMWVEINEDDIGNTSPEETADDIVKMGDAFGVVTVLEAKWSAR
jgi:hypothetical protein